jgi:hypothetical protein
MQACRYFLDKFGFVQRTNFIDWNLSTEYNPLPQLIELFEEFGILFPTSRRYAKRTIASNFRAIMKQFRLNSYKLKFKDQNGHSFLEIWGNDEGCLEGARLLFSNIRKDITFY